MALVLPAAFFAALDRGTLSDLTHEIAQTVSAAAATVTGHAAEATETAAAAGTEAGHLILAAEGHHLNPRELYGLLTDQRRGEFLKFSRAIAVILLLMYVLSPFLSSKSNERQICCISILPA
jgi:Ca2+:H+ antiporter